MSVLAKREHHPRYGEIKITINQRARNIILRARAGIIEVTLPPRATRADMENALDRHGEKLLAECRTTMPEIIDNEYKVATEGFSFMLSAHAGSRYILRYKGTVATLLYPETVNFNDAATQELLRRIRITALRHIANEHLPQRLGVLAGRYGFLYNAASLRDSHTRWGSCSSKRNISLSIYLQLLPTRLSDYVMLHELCHTVEMNHGASFWELMNRVTDGKAKMLRGELKRYKPSF